MTFLANAVLSTARTLSVLAGMACLCATTLTSVDAAPSVDEPVESRAVDKPVDEQTVKSSSTPQSATGRPVTNKAQQAVSHLPPAPASGSSTAPKSTSGSSWAIWQMNPPGPSSGSSFPNLGDELLTDIAQRLKLPLPLPGARIEVHKSKRRLDLYSKNTLVKSYRVALGANPVGHKLRQGDNRTPEGQFYICTRNSTTSAFHIFLGLSYPMLPDAQRGLRNKAISPTEYHTIRDRLASRKAPLWETELGGWIGIHGGTDAAFAQKKMLERGSTDWTAGCIAVTDWEIEEIYAATQLGAPVFVWP